MRYSAISLTILALSLSGCLAQHRLMKQPPTAMGPASCQAWSGGREASGAGLDLRVRVEGREALEWHKAYFRGRVADLATEEGDDGRTVVARFVDRSKGKPDMVMHADSEREVGNAPPTLDPNANEAFPFDIADDEVVLSYRSGKKIKYFKVSGVKEKRPQLFQ